MSMRIEMVTASLPAAGLEMVIAYLIRGLAHRGYDVGVTCIESKGYLGEQLEAEGHRVTVVPVPGVSTNFFSPDLAEWFARLEPDVVHVHSGAWLKGVTGARQGNVRRTVFTLHGIYPVEPWYFPILTRIASRRTDHAVAVSNTLREYLISRGMPPSRTSVIPNGVDCDRFQPEPGRALDLRAQLGIPAEAFVVGNVARLHPVKNHALLVEAFAGLYRQNASAVLLLVGEGELQGELERQVDQLGLQGAVRFLGFTPDPAALYNAFDLFALSSVIEGTSMAALEAMASGTPVLATAVGGTPALLGDGRWGELVPAQDPHAMTSAMVRLASDDVRRATLARDARAHVLSTSSVEHLIDSYEEVYSTTPASRSGRAAS